MNTEGKTERIIQFDYDLAGRVTEKKESLVSEAKDLKKKVRSYEYLYDGMTPNGVILEGQTGFLTTIESSDFTKSFLYRPDGLLAHSKITIPEWGTFEEEITYQPDGSIASTQVKLKQVGEGERTINQAFQRDSLGRLSEIILSQKPLAKITYDDWSLLNEVEILDEKLKTSRQFRYDRLTHSLTEMKGTNLGDPFSSSWLMNDRGLIESEQLALGKASGNRSFAYSPNRSLISEVSRGNKFSYDYNRNSLLTSDPTFEHSLDSSGRVIATPSANIQYGASGRVEKVALKAGTNSNEIGNQDVTYSYDENGKRIFKRRGGKIVEVYIGDRVILGGDIIQPLKVNGILLGILKGESFVPIAADTRGSTAYVKRSTLDYPTTYGERSKLPETYSSAVDFASQGYDPDLQAYRMDQRDYDP